MKEKSVSQKKSKNSNKRSKINEDTSYNYYSSSRDFRTTKVRGIMEFFLCIKNSIISIKKILFKGISRLSFLMQSIIFKIPLLIIIILFLVEINMLIFVKIFSNNYYYAVKNEYLNELTKEITNKYFELDTLKIKTNFDELEELLFFNIYFKEMVKMGLIDENKNIQKNIFPPIDNRSSTIYSTLNKINSNFGMNSDYNIPIDDINKGFTESSTILSEFGKIYFYLLPSIAADLSKHYKFLNQSFLIAYEYDESKNEIDDKNFFYFAYPKSNSKYNSGNNFHPGNVLINPKIFKSNNNNFSNELFENNSYDSENWFSKQDFLFRNNSNNINKSVISFEHLNYEYFGLINKTFIASLQYYLENKNKKYIINLINFFHQNNFSTNDFSYSIFLLNNNSDIYKPLEIKKYSDNESFVISQNNITEISMSYVLYNYFHYGIKDNHNNYYQLGVSFDNFDLNKMSGPSRYYETVKEFYGDLIFISQVYLFGKLFQRSGFNTYKTIKEDLNVYEFYNEEEIKKICKVFNFDAYIPHIKSFDINCENINIVDKVSDNLGEDIDYLNKIKIPYCGCFVFNCLDQSNYTIDEQYKSKDYIFVKKLKLPDRCLNYFQRYKKEEKSPLNSLIKKIMDRFLINEEKSFITFQNVPKISFQGLSHYIITTIDNTYLLNVLTALVSKLTYNEIYFLMISVVWLIILIILSVFIIILETRKFSNLIYDFDAKYEKYLYQLESNEMIEKKTKNYIETDKSLKATEKEPLLGEITHKKTLRRFTLDFDSFTNNIQDSNPLLNELFYMFCDFYKLDAEETIKKEQIKNEKSRKEIKADIMSKKNELFELFVKLCSYESKINFSIESGLYSNAPLINKYNNSIKKGKITNRNEEKSTRDVIYELLSTENVFDGGLVANFNFAYISYLNLDDYNSIKNALFNKDVDFSRDNFNMKQKFKDDQRKSYIKLLLKNKNVLYNELHKYYDFDEIKFDRLESCFNQFLLNVYYKYLKKILVSKKILN